MLACRLRRRACVVCREGTECGRRLPGSGEGARTCNGERLPGAGEPVPAATMEHIRRKALSCGSNSTLPGAGGRGPNLLASLACLP